MPQGESFCTINDDGIWNANFFLLNNMAFLSSSLMFLRHTFVRSFES